MKRRRAEIVIAEMRKATRYHVQERLVEEINDQSILVEIARDTSLFDCTRGAALRRLKSKRTLAELAKNGVPPICSIAVERLNNQRLLADVARNAERVDTRIAAAEKLRSKSVLFKLAITDSSSRGTLGREIVERVTKPSLLAKIAQKAEHSKVRQAAAEKLRQTGR